VRVMRLVIGKKIAGISVVEGAVFQVQGCVWGCLFLGHGGISSAPTESNEGSHKSQRSYDFSKSYAHTHPPVYEIIRNYLMRCRNPDPLVLSESCTDSPQIISLQFIPAPYTVFHKCQDILCEMGRIRVLIRSPDVLKNPQHFSLT
jgi:hypothetical protein